MKILILLTFCGTLFEKAGSEGQFPTGDCGGPLHVGSPNKYEPPHHKCRDLVEVIKFPDLKCNQCGAYKLDNCKEIVDCDEQCDVGCDTSCEEDSMRQTRKLELAKAIESVQPDVLCAYRASIQVFNNKILMSLRDLFGVHVMDALEELGEEVAIVKLFYLYHRVVEKFNNEPLSTCWDIFKPLSDILTELLEIMYSPCKPLLDDEERRERRTYEMHRYQHIQEAYVANMVGQQETRSDFSVGSPRFTNHFNYMGDWADPRNIPDHLISPMQQEQLTKYMLGVKYHIWRAHGGDIRFPLEHLNLILTLLDKKHYLDYNEKYNEDGQYVPLTNEEILEKDESIAVIHDLYTRIGQQVSTILDEVFNTYLDANEEQQFFWSQFGAIWNFLYRFEHNPMFRSGQSIGFGMDQIRSHMIQHIPFLKDEIFGYEPINLDPYPDQWRREGLENPHVEFATRMKEPYQVFPWDTWAHAKADIYKDMYDYKKDAGSRYKSYEKK